MERVADAVKSKLSEDSLSVFSNVQLAHLEFVKPDIADVCDSMELAGCSRIVAYPLFISVSSHSERDIPNALNVRYHDFADPDIRRYTGNAPITYTCPLDHGPVLPLVVAECASEISLNPETESVLILSHGGGCEHFWEHMHRRVAQAVTDTVKISNVHWMTVQTGRSPQSQDALVDKLHAIGGTDKILILSCFGGLSGTQFIERISQGLVRRNKPSLESLFADRLVGCKGWIEKPCVIEEIVSVVNRAAGASTGAKLVKESYPPYNPPFK